MSDTSASDSDSSVGVPPNFVSSKRTLKTTRRPHSSDQNTSLGDAAASSSPDLIVNPSEIHFDGVEAGILYTFSIRVRNVSPNPQRVRISAPKTNYFALNYIPTGPIAPGLEIQAEVECQIPQDRGMTEFLDVLVIQGNRCRIKLPIVAQKPVPKIVFNSFLNLGVLGLGCPVSALKLVLGYCSVADDIQGVGTVRFTNEGNAVGSFEIEYDKSLPIVFEPDHGEIQSAPHVRDMIAPQIL